MRLIRNTEPKHQNTGWSYRARDDDSWQSVLRDTLAVAVAGHQIRGEDIDQSAADVEG